MIEGIRRILRNLCQKHLNRFNESVLRKKQMSYYLIYERKTLGIPFVVKKVFKVNRTIRITS